MYKATIHSNEFNHEFNNRLRRVALQRRGRTLKAIPLVVERGLSNRIENVERAYEVTLPWRERMLFSRQGWQWAPPLPTSVPATRKGYMRIVDTRGYLPRDSRVIDRDGYDTVRYGWVATAWLYVADMFETPTGRRDVRQWVAPTGELYVYNLGIEPGDPYTFEIYTPPTKGEDTL